MDINRWLQTNTFHHRQFWDLMRLIEEKTIGKELVLFRSELMDRYPLLDELAVIDSGSTDRTLEVAAAFGADVYLSSDILPQLGNKRGKGENLWKTIYQLNSDIICYPKFNIVIRNSL